MTFIPARVCKELKNPQNGIVLTALVPTFLFYLVFLIVPMLYAFYLSFHKWSFVGSPQYVGISNYIKALTDDPLFYTALINTTVYTVVTVPVGLMIGLILAFWLNGFSARIVSVYRTIYFLPAVTSLVVDAILWRWLYQPRFGLFNQMLRLGGLPQFLWLESPKLALPSIMLMTLWRGAGYNIVIFLAGLNGIPASIFEAALIDGASRFHIFWNITVPLLRPAITFVAVIGVISSFQVFTEMYILTRGGPFNATRTIVFHLYERSFEYFQMGYGSAIAFILFFIIVIFSFVQMKLLRTPWEY